MFKRNNNNRLEVRIPAFCFRISNVKKTFFSITNTLFLGKKSEQQLDYWTSFYIFRFMIKIFFTGSATTEKICRKMVHLSV